MLNKHYKKITYLLGASVLASSCLTTSAWASGFQLIDHSVSALRTAFAGTAAAAEDASIGFYNSAGLTLLGEEQIAVSLIGVGTNSRLRATRATPTFSVAPAPAALSPIVFIPTTAGTLPNIGPGHARSRPISVIPAVHYALRLSDCAVFGLSITTPFGLKTKYKNDSVIRYISTRGEIRTYDICPSIGIALGHGVSVGGGLDIMNTIARFDNRVGFGVPLRDGLFENTVSRWSLGAHVGFMLEFTDFTRIGAQYRSGSTVHARGQSRTESPIFGSFAALPTLVTQGIRAGLRLPGTAVLSGYHGVTECWALMFDVQYTNWKRFDKLIAKFDDGTQLVQRFDFRDTWRYALGTSYQFSECWLGSLGAAYDRSPVKNANRRTALVPDSNRTWVAIGAQYRILDCLTLDMGYAHIFFKKVDIHQGPPSFNGRIRPRQSVDGRYKSHADLLGLQITWEIA